MGSLIELYTSFKRIDFKKLLDECIEEKQGLIIGLNTRKQLYEKGIDSMGQPLEPPYTGFTKSIKRRKGQPVNRVTLKDTGAFYEGFEIGIEPNFIDIFSTDNKSKKLTDKYGDDIYGLTDENTAILAEQIKPVLLNKTRQQIGI